MLPDMQQIMSRSVCNNMESTTGHIIKWSHFCLVLKKKKKAKEKHKLGYTYKVSARIPKIINSGYLGGPSVIWLKRFFCIRI